MKKIGLIHYIIGGIISFILITLLTWFFIVKPHAKQKASENPLALSDSTDAAATDSTNNIAQDSTDIRFDANDPLPGMSILSLEDHVRILRIENARRQKEIDHLWSELLALVNKVKAPEENLEYLTPEKRKEMEEKIAQLQTELEDAQKLLATREDEIKTLKENEQEKVTSDMSMPQQTPDTVQKQTMKETAKIYAEMKPQNAAQILAQIEKDEVAQILANMRQRQAAKILSAMQPQRAAQICMLMEKQRL